MLPAVPLSERKSKLFVCSLLPQKYNSTYVFCEKQTKTLLYLQYIPTKDIFWSEMIEDTLTKKKG